MATPSSTTSRATTPPISRASSQTSLSSYKDTSSDEDQPLYKLLRQTTYSIHRTLKAQSERNDDRRKEIARKALKTAKKAGNPNRIKYALNQDSQNARNYFARALRSSQAPPRVTRRFNFYNYQPGNPETLILNTIRMYLRKQ